MEPFNDGAPYHGSDRIVGGNLKGATGSSDYFYFSCPNCPDNEILRILEYREHEPRKPNPHNVTCTRAAKYGFTLVFNLYCEQCGLSDFVKVSNAGLQGEQHAHVLMR